MWWKKKEEGWRVENYRVFGGCSNCGRMHWYQFPKGQRTPKKFKCKICDCKDAKATEPYLDYSL